jgi:anti-sigma-K factor RskA
LRHEGITEDGQEMAALYALGALGQNEARAFEAHLHEGCAACLQELQEYEGVVGAIGSSAEELAPPVYLRDLLKARLEKETQVSSQAETAQGAIIPFPIQHQTREPARNTLQSSPLRTWHAWVIAASLLIALLGSLLLWRSDRRALQASINNSREETLAAVKESEELRRRVIKGNARAEELAQINSVIASPSQFEVLSLKPTGDAPATMASSSGTVYWNKRDQRWVVTADLPNPPEGKAYQLWFVTDGAPVSAGLIEPDETGHGFTVVSVPANVEKIVAAAITLEPQGGSPQPTMPILAMGKAA